MKHTNLKSQILIAAATTVLATTFFPGSAHAGIKELNAHMISQSVGNPPYMDMHFANGKWVWKNQSDEFWPKLMIRMTSKIHHIKDGNVTLHSAGTKNVAGVLWSWRGGKEYKKVGKFGVYLGKQQLQGSANSAAGLCHMSGGSKKVIREMALPISINAIATKGGWVKKWGSIPVRVVCQPKPKEPSRVAMKLNKVKLYTAPGKPKCGTKTLMVAEFWANQPGKVNFTYQRNDGEKANGSVTVKKVKGGYAGTWHRIYKFDRSVDRKYMIIAKGHPVSTNWVPLKVSCGVAADHKNPGKFKS